MELENRMISAEYLKTRCYEICDEYNTNHVNIDRLIDEIDNAPDVEVVRCKDCKHCDFFYPRKEIGKEPIPAWYCRTQKSNRKPDDFCSYGERRSET